MKGETTYMKTLGKVEAKLSRMKEQAAAVRWFYENGNLPESYNRALRLEELSEQTVLLTRVLPAYTGAVGATTQTDAIISDTIPVEVGFTAEGWFSIRIPALLPKKASGSADYIRSYLYPAMRKFFEGKPPVRFRDCVLAYRHVYDRSRPERSMRDHDNIETNMVTDILALYVLPDDHPAVCSHYYCSAAGSEDRTEVYVIPKHDFPVWMVEEKTLPDKGVKLYATFAAWSGWEEKMAAAFIAGNAQDVCQVNWNWLYNYSADGSKFVDLNTTSKFIDLTQWDSAAMDACYVANSQQCVPVSMTGRIFYWNMTTFNKAGITEVPKSLDDLMAAGKAFQEKLGDDYYPMHLGAYDRMILMVFYLESKYGKDWADPTTSTLNYTADEIAEGIDFIKSLVDGHVIMPLPTYYGANGDGATHQSNEWITGKIAGIFEWDSAASKYQDALDEENKPGFTVGEEIKFGDYNGGFSKVSMGMAITKTCKNPAEAATLIEYLWNGDGAAIMGSECGVPASKAGLATAQAAGKINELVAEANGKVMSFVSCQLDPLFESSDLKATGTGIYQEVFDTVDYDNKSGADVVDTLLDGMSAVGYTV